MAHNLFEIHPLPWTYKSLSPAYVTYQNPTKTVLVDANDKEINMTSTVVLEGLKKMTELLPKKFRQSLGDISTKLYVVKDTIDGTYWRKWSAKASLIRAQYYRTEHNAQRRARRLNNSCTLNGTPRYKVVEIKLEEKSNVT